MAISGITTTANNGVERITNTQTITGTGSATGECLVLDNSASYLECTGTGVVSLEDCAIILDADVGTGNDATSPLNYGGRTVTGTTFELDYCHVIAGPFTARRNIQVTDLRNVNIIEQDGTGEMFVYTRGGGDIINVYLKGINVWEVYGPPANLANVRVDGPDSGYLNWEAGRLDFFNFAVANIGISHIWVGSGASDNHCYHWNNDSSFDNQLLYFAAANNEYHEGFTSCWKFIDQLTGSSVEDVKVLLRDDYSGSMTLLGTYTTNSSGLMVGTWDSQNRSTGSSIVRDVLFMQTIWTDYVDTGNPGSGTYPIASIDAGNGARQENYDLAVVTNEIEVRSYLHQAPTGHEEGDDFVPTAEIGKRDTDGSVLTYQNFVLLPDAGITQTTQATVAAYTTLETLDKLYDRIKSEWYDNNSYPLPVFVGVAIDLGAVDLIVDGNASSAYAFSAGDITISTNTGSLNLGIGTTIKEITTTGTVTVQDSATINGIVINGDVVLTSEVDLSNLTINGDLNINISGVDAVLAFSNVTVTGSVNNDNSSNTLIINLTNGSSLTAGDPGTADGETNILQTVPIKVTVKDIEDGSLLENARVLIKAVAGGDLPASASITSITRSGSVATVTHTSHGMATGEKIYISGANQSEYNSHHQITVTGVNTYTFTVAGTPATPATGTIIGTAIIVNELTDVDGEINENHRYTGDQPVDGWVRKATL